MAVFEWKNEYSVGNVTMDLQHKELVRRINSFLDAMQLAKGGGELEKLLPFLKSYVLEHFGTEEQLMQKHRYPDINAHKAEHAHFTTEMNKLVQELQSGGPKPTVVLKAQSLLVDWLRKHILSVDKKLGAYLKDKAA